MAELEDLVDEMADEVQEAGFADFSAVADALQQLVSERGQEFTEVQADALQLAVDILCSLERRAQTPG